MIIPLYLHSDSLLFAYDEKLQSEGEGKAVKMKIIWVFCRRFDKSVFNGRGFEKAEIELVYRSL